MLSRSGIVTVDPIHRGRSIQSECRGRRHTPATRSAEAHNEPAIWKFFILPNHLELRYDLILIFVWDGKVCNHILQGIKDEFYINTHCSDWTVIIICSSFFFYVWPRESKYYFFLSFSSFITCFTLSVILLTERGQAFKWFTKPVKLMVYFRLLNANDMLMMHFCLCADIGIGASQVKTRPQTSLGITHTHQVPETGSRAPSLPPRGWQRAAGGSGAAGWAQLPSVPPASGRRGPPALGPPPPPAGSSPGSPASSAWAGSARWDSGSPHLWPKTDPLNQISEEVNSWSITE